MAKKEPIIHAEAEVKALQKLLGIPETGLFDAATNAALFKKTVEWQAKYNEGKAPEDRLKIDGRMGPNTLAALEKSDPQAYKILKTLEDTVSKQRGTGPDGKPVFGLGTLTPRIKGENGHPPKGGELTADQVKAITGISVSTTTAPPATPGSPAQQGTPPSPSLAPAPTPAPAPAAPATPAPSSSTQPPPATPVTPTPSPTLGGDLPPSSSADSLVMGGSGAVIAGAGVTAVALRNRAGKPASIPTSSPTPGRAEPPATPPVPPEDGLPKNRHVSTLNRGNNGTSFAREMAADATGAAAKDASFLSKFFSAAVKPVAKLLGPLALVAEPAMAAADAPEGTKAQAALNNTLSVDFVLGAAMLAPSPVAVVAGATFGLKKAWEEGNRNYAAEQDALAETLAPQMKEEADLIRNAGDRYTGLLQEVGKAAGAPISTAEDAARALQNETVFDNLWNRYQDKIEEAVRDGAPEIVNEASLNMALLQEFMKTETVRRTAEEKFKNDRDPARAIASGYDRDDTLSLPGP